MKYNTTFCLELVVPDLMEHIRQESRRQSLRGTMIHLDNEQRHNSRKSEAILTAAKGRRISAPVYGPELSRSGFFLFGMLKELLS
jgi:hypothetical protein